MTEPEHRPFNTSSGGPGANGFGLGPWEPLDWFPCLSSKSCADVRRFEFRPIIEPTVKLRPHGLLPPFTPALIPLRGEGNVMGVRRLLMARRRVSALLPPCALVTSAATCSLPDHDTLAPPLPLTQRGLE
jgi:hypothetical protein